MYYPGHARRNRFAHDHDQRARRGRLGRGGDRSRGRDARAAGLLADAGRGRRAHARTARRRRHRDRPRSLRHRDAPQGQGRRKVRRVLRRGGGLALGDRPRHGREHGSGVRRHDGVLPRGRRVLPLPSRDRPHRRAGRRLPRLLRGAGHVRHPPARATATTPKSSSSTWPGARQRRRPEASAGSHRPAGHEIPLPRALLEARIRERVRQARAGAVRALRRDPRAGRPRPGGGSQHPPSVSGALARDTNVWTEAEMANNRPTPDRSAVPQELSGRVEVGHGDVLIAAITSCTNTSNPSVMLAAGILARKAVERGLSVSPRVKASLAPGSRVVTEYLHKTGLQPYLDQLGFGLVGYGCTTCIGNSGPLDAGIEDVVTKNDLVTASVLSGNRNFEARVHQSIRANYLMSPPLVVAFAIAGRADVDLASEPLGRDRQGMPVYLRDVWPSSDEDPVGPARLGRRGDVPPPLRGPRGREPAVDGDPDGRRHLLCVGRRLDLHSGAALLRGIHPHASAGRRRAPRPRPRHLRRLGDDGSHQPGRRHQEGLPRRSLPAGPRRQARGFQQLRCAPRQRSRDDARERSRTCASRTSWSRASKGATRSTSLPANASRSTTPRCATRPSACPS